MRDMEIRKNYHHEYGGYVYQPYVDEIDRFIEPYITEKEAKAYLDGVRHAFEQVKKKAQSEDEPN